MVLFGFATLSPLSAQQWRKSVQIGVRLGELCFPLGEVSGEVSDCLFRRLFCVRIFLKGFTQKVHGVIDKMQKKFIELLQRNWFAPFAALISKSKCQKATLPLRLAAPSATLRPSMK